jgi:hypothetical protein
VYDLTPNELVAVDGGARDVPGRFASTQALHRLECAVCPSLELHFDILCIQTAQVRASA